jgi:hypothetical protein
MLSPIENPSVTVALAAPGTAHASRGITGRTFDPISFSGRAAVCSLASLLVDDSPALPVRELDAMAGRPAIRAARHWTLPLHRTGNSTVSNTLLLCLILFDYAGHPGRL